MSSARRGRWRGLGDDLHPVIEPQNKIFVCQTPPAKAVIWVGKITGVKISENWNRVLEFFQREMKGFHLVGIIFEGFGSRGKEKFLGGNVLLRAGWGLEQGWLAEYALIE